jgi:hypothetical protein
VQAAEDEKNKIKQDIATSKSERKDKFESEFYGSNNG